MKLNKSYLLVIIATLLWGGSPAIMKFTLEQVPIFSLAFMRFFFASLVMAFIIYAFYKKPNNNLKIARRDWLTFFLAGFFGVTLNISFFFLALKLSPAISASILIAADPILTLVLAHFYLKEKFRLHLILATIVGIIGIAIIVGRPFGVTTLAQTIGGIFMILASATAAIHEIISKKLLKNYSGEIVAFYSMFVGACTFLPLAIFELSQNTFWISHVNLAGILGILYGIFGASLIAYWAWMKGLAKLGAGEAAFFFYLDPVFGAILAMIILGERLTAQTVIGALFITAAVFLAEYHRKKHPLPNKL